MKKENENEIVVTQTCYSIERKLTQANEDNLNIERNMVNAITEVRPSKKSKTLTLDEASEYDLRGMKATFPNITSLKIGEKVTNIKMLNKTFPNIRKVKSSSPHFLSGDMLVKNIKNSEESFNILLNAFCRKSEEPTNLEGVSEIADLALDGCLSSDMKCTHSLRAFFKNALKGSAFDFENEDTWGGDGPVMFGSCLIGFKRNTSSFNLTESLCVDNFVLLDNYKPITKISVSRAKLLHIFSNIPDDRMICDYLYINDTSDFRSELLKQCIPLPAAHVQINPDNEYLKSENDVICNGDGTTVEASAWFISGKVEIPDGVRRVEKDGFLSDSITELHIPDSVSYIQADSMWNCDKIKLIETKGENLPRGCVSAVCRDFLPVNDDKDDVIEIISKNAHVFIPRYVSEKYISTIDMLCNEDLASVNDTFRYALSNTVKYHVLKKNYEVLKDKSCLDTIKKSIVSILISLIKDGKIDEAVNLVSDYDFAKEISDILECVKKNKNITVVDYDAFLTKLKERRLIS